MSAVLVERRVQRQLRGLEVLRRDARRLQRGDDLGRPDRSSAPARPAPTRRWLSTPSVTVSVSGTPSTLPVAVPVIVRGSTSSVVAADAPWARIPPSSSADRDDPDRQRSSVHACRPLVGLGELAVEVRRVGRSAARW